MGNNFDLFIKYRDYIPEQLRRYINRARLFEFDLYPTETIDLMSKDEVKELADSFCLPFPVVAIEDKTSCVILWDKFKNSVGIEFSRGMIEIIDTENYLKDEAFKLTSQDIENGINEKNMRESKDMLKDIAKKTGGFPVVLRTGYGVVRWIDQIKKWEGKVDVRSCVYIMKNGEVLDFITNLKNNPRERISVDTDCMRGMTTAYEELLRMSSRNQFILEKSPKKASKNTKYLKSHERPVYTVLNPNKARKVMRLPEPIVDKPIGKKKTKERRAYVRAEHERFLGSEKFTKKQGQTVSVKRTYVPAIWRGNFCSETESHFYKVILDLPKGIRESCDGE